MTATPRATGALDELRQGLRGRLLTPDDAEYDSARRVAAGHVDSRPAAIARPVDARDVATAIAFGRRAGLELAVRSGGHDGVGYSTVEGGLVIDLRDMKALDIDPRGRTAWAQAGLTAGEVVRAAAEHGLVIGFGDTGSVGIGGITLGGGIGYLVRKRGLTIDSLLGAEIVTASGEVLRVDAEAHPDLYWAIRGGGGNFGVVTSFHYRLQPAEDFVGGMLVLPATAAVLAGFMDAAAAAPEQLSAIANVMGCPPMPFVPEDWHGRPVLLAMIAHTGDLAAGEAAMAPFRALAEPVADLLRPMPYPEMFPAEEEDPEYRGPRVVGQTFFMRGLDTAAAQAIVEALEASDAEMKAVQLRPLGGAMARVPADATAFAHRRAGVLSIVVSTYQPADEQVRQAWVDDLVEHLRDGSGGAYVNFVGDEGEAGVRRAYPPATLARLARIKAQYDPDNVFRRNQNISPAG